MIIDTQKHPFVPFAVTSGASMLLGMLLLWSVQTIGTGPVELPDVTLASRTGVVSTTKVANLVETAVAGTAFDEAKAPAPVTQVAGSLTKRDGNTVSLSGVLATADETLDTVIFPAVPSADVTLFSTYDAKAMKSRVYSYDASTATFNTLYTEPTNARLKLFGMDGSKVVALYDGFDNSPGPCWNAWSGGGEFGALELANIADGMRRYVPSQTLMQKGADESIACEKELKSPAKAPAKKK